MAFAIACVALPAFAQQSPNVLDTPAIDAPASVDPEADGLQPGEFLWTPERAAPGQVVVVVSLPTQRAHVYRNGVRIGVSTVSTGMPGHPTPTGTFEILQKKRLNHSNLYNNAPMPFMQRLTWDGIALHAGKIPGYPASHGCVRLPLAFAEALYGETERGMLVVIADETSHDTTVAYPGPRAPVDAYSGAPVFAPADDAPELAGSAP
ncbi:MAG: hypothetical protein EOP93_12780 [Lysobacteraceae bacterium]|nr:MAG: hypothetical protein EOP93_12780 [Xanthomonadaceae bacterium]